MQQPIFDRNFIFERIKDSKYPFWSLGLWQGFKNIANVMQYYGDDFEDADTDDTKIEKSIARLNHTISTFPAKSIFVIEIKNAKQANGSGIIGAFQFSNSDSIQDEESEKQPAPGLGQIPAGFVPESMLKGVEDRISAEFDAKLEKYKAESERREREAEFKRREESLDEREKELKDLEKEYNSSVAKTADIFIEIGKRIGSYFLSKTQPAGGNVVINSQPQQQLGHPQEVDEKMQTVDEFAEFLYKEFDTESIKKLKSNLIECKKNAELEKQSSSADNATATATE